MTREQFRAMGEFLGGLMPDPPKDWYVSAWHEGKCVLRPKRLLSVPDDQWVDSPPDVVHVRPKWSCPEDIPPGRCRLDQVRLHRKDGRVIRIIMNLPIHHGRLELIEGDTVGPDVRVEFH